MTPGTTLDRLLGRIPISPPPPLDLIILHYQHHVAGKQVSP